MKIILAITCFTVILSSLNAENAKIDSLKNELSKNIHDTTKCNLYFEIGYIYENISPEEAIEYYDKCLQIATSNDYLPLQARALSNIGVAYRKLGFYEKAISFYTQALTINKTENNMTGIANCYTNIGNVYYFQGNHKKAIEYHHKSLQIKEEQGDILGMANSFNNIGLINRIQQNYDDAIFYYQKSLDIYIDLDNVKGKYVSHNNIGNAYFEQGGVFQKQEQYEEAEELYKKATEYLEKSLKISEETRDKSGMSAGYNNMGNIYLKRGSLLQNDKSDFKQSKLNYNRAIKYFNKSISIKTDMGDKRGLAITYNNLSELHANIAEIAKENEKQQIYEVALDYAYKSFNLALELETLPIQNDALASLIRIFKSLGQTEEALNHAEKLITTREALFNKEKTKALTEIQVKYETEKKEQEIDKQKLIIKSQELENRRQRTQRNYLIAGGLLMTILLLVVFASYKQNIRNSNTIKEKNVILEQANEEINAQHDMVLMQKKQIETQKGKITDSISYAKFIQAAVLPSEEFMSSLIQDFFILFKPKEIVSGDFFWASKVKNSLIIAVADCTGHGVPGAFMSMLGMSFLKEIVGKKEIIIPNQILDLIRESIIDTLQQKGLYGGQNEGIDMGLCVLNTTNNVLDYAGAKIPLIIVRQSKEITIVEPDIQPLATHKKLTPFSGKRIKLNKGDKIYLTTDGYQDQFGGSEHRRFTSQKLKNLIISISDKPMALQKDILEKTFMDWKKHEEQIDDVTILGVGI